MIVKNRWLSVAAAAALMVALVGCDATKGGDGNDGAAGVAGAAGADGADGTDGVTTTDLYTPVSSNFRTPVQKASEQMLIAEGLTVEYVTREVANKADMGEFYPYGSSTPTHFVTCVEGGAEEINATSGKLNPSVQSIKLDDGTVTTHLRGMERCDGARVTPWGTVLATEEAGATGAAYEIIDIFNVSDHQVTDRDAGTIVDGIGSSTASTKVVKRTNLMAMSWEGLAILPSGVVIGGDELRPGTGTADSDGGNIFKFIPTTLRTATTDITALSESPLVDGMAYALQVRANSSQYGQGAEVGYARWIEVNASDARASGDELGATGYYRPEDLHLDPTFEDESNPEAVRFCWANTQNEGGKSYGEIMCAIDNNSSYAPADQSVEVNRFVEGDLDFTSVDNLAFQPESGILYGIEDHSHGDVWACLPDGDDRDVKSDGCVKLLSLHDTSAEPTGFAFHPDGTKAYFFIQHSADGNMDKVDDYNTDDMIVISGFDVPSKSVTKNFGVHRDADIHANADALFGFSSPKTSSASGQVDRNTTIGDVDAEDGIIELADGLTATFMTREVANKADMGEFYPYGSSTPTHFVTCVEGSAEEINATTGKLNPSVQSIKLSDGTVTTHLRGMSKCDGARVTPWGTVLVTEEAGATGSAYEIIDIMNVTNHQVTDRDAGTIVDAIGSTTASTKVIKRTNLMSMSWEGLVILPSGVVIGGDELRPGTGTADADGGSIFKFIPTTLRTATTDIAALSESPLVDGTAYALQVRASSSQYGQGAEVGYARWIEVNASDARASADELGATGYYRPEDMHLDPTFVDADNADAIKFCWNNTQSSSAKSYAELMCAVDSTPDEAPASQSVEVNRLVEGDTDFNSFDNLAFQPTTGNVYIIEDTSSNADVIACLPDGNDRDIKSDGCVRLLSLKDTTAEPTGFAFHPNGTEAYVFIQHSGDTGIAKVDDYGTDDMIKITGFGTVSTTGFSAMEGFGATTQQKLHDYSQLFFGFGKPIVNSSTK